MHVTIFFDRQMSCVHKNAATWWLCNYSWAYWELICTVYKHNWHNFKLNEVSTFTINNHWSKCRLEFHVNRSNICYLPLVVYKLLVIRLGYNRGWHAVSFMLRRKKEFCRLISCVHHPQFYTSKWRQTLTNTRLSNCVNSMNDFFLKFNMLYRLGLIWSEH